MSGDPQPLGWNVYGDKGDGAPGLLGYVPRGTGPGEAATVGGALLEVFEPDANARFLAMVADGCTGDSVMEQPAEPGPFQPRNRLRRWLRPRCVRCKRTMWWFGVRRYLTKGEAMHLECFCAGVLERG